MIESVRIIAQNRNWLYCLIFDGTMVWKKRNQPNDVFQPGFCYRIWVYSSCACSQSERKYNKWNYCVTRLGFFHSFNRSNSLKIQKGPEAAGGRPGDRCEKKERLWRMLLGRLVLI